MKSDERQQLDKNDLEDILARAWAFLQKYGTHVLLVVALAVLGFEVYRWYENGQINKLHDAWGYLNDAENATNPPGRYRNVIADYNFPDVQALAYVGLGDFYSNVIALGGVPPQYQGVTATVADAATEARKAYQQVLQQFPNQKLAVLRAQLGLAKLDEDAGQFDEARQLYQQVLAAHKSDAWGDYVQSRLDRLNVWSTPVVLAKPLPTTAPSTAPESLGPTLPSDLTLPSALTPTGIPSAVAPAVAATVPATAPTTAPAATAPATMPATTEPAAH